MAVTNANLENWFSTKAVTPDQQKKIESIQVAALNLAEIIAANTLPSADQTTAVRTTREAMLWAIQAIVCNGE